ncbi:PTS sugar transporter subunit IIA [Erwinia sp. S38]|uniref:PTS sugar transporter subunit IIA n=1 Tax=Erwinia sp. S38 TaxID=2769338 RepID=UPI00190AD8DC|nr:PTS sugar transporter subunit IIA [Erwinia sp. S38]MBK0003569.1 PTS sugar transporter subunit IIA [Erwinia sp. S38]
MLKLSEEVIYLDCQAANKTEAIKIAADELEKAGYVKPGFFEAMLKREKDVSTCIGAGISFPHCAKEHIDLVKKTGFLIFQFPNGVSWGAGQVVFIMVAVAATKNEHVQVLADIADMLGDDANTLILASAKTKREFIDQFEQH